MTKAKVEICGSRGAWWANLYWPFGEGSERLHEYTGPYRKTRRLARADADDVLRRFELEEQR